MTLGRLPEHPLVEVGIPGDDIRDFAEGVRDIVVDVAPLPREFEQQDVPRQAVDRARPWRDVPDRHGQFGQHKAPGRVDNCDLDHFSRRIQPRRFGVEDQDVSAVEPAPDVTCSGHAIVSVGVGRCRTIVRRRSSVTAHRKLIQIGQESDAPVLDGQPITSPSAQPTGRGRDRLGQQLVPARPARTVRRDETVGYRPGRRRQRAGVLHGETQRLRQALNQTLPLTRGGIQRHRNQCDICMQFYC